jgi:hypothetical protein
MFNHEKKHDCEKKKHEPSMRPICDLSTVSDSTLDTVYNIYKKFLDEIGAEIDRRKEEHAEKPEKIDRVGKYYKLLLGEEKENGTKNSTTYLVHIIKELNDTLDIYRHFLADKIIENTHENNGNFSTSFEEKQGIRITEKGLEDYEEITEEEYNKFKEDYYNGLAKRKVFWF